MKIGLLVEGGAMRTVFACGAMDALLDSDINCDYFIGVSAGIANGVSYISKQRERGRDIIIGYANDSRYMGFKNLLRLDNRSYYGVDFAFRVIPTKENIFDYRAFESFKGEVKAVVSNLETGKSEYLDVKADNMMSEIIIASCSLPLMFPVKKIGDKKYLDGGVCDPIPIQKVFEDGCDKVIAIMSREYGYRKKTEKSTKITERVFKNYPKFCTAMKIRPAIYNSKIKIVEELERNGKIKVIRPLSTSGIGRLEKDTVKLIELYEQGYNQTMDQIESIKQYINEE